MAHVSRLTLRTMGNLRNVRVVQGSARHAFAYWDTHLYALLCLGLAVLARVVASGRNWAEASGPLGYPWGLFAGDGEAGSYQLAQSG
jgi:hypothetical protein